VLIGTNKVAGSAQRRHGGALLQHGSVLLAASDFAPELPGINGLVRCTLEVPQLVNEWLGLLEAALGVAFSLATLQPAELVTIKEVADTRYSTKGWSRRR
jgi:lipoate-protein ligase A